MRGELFDSTIPPDAPELLKTSAFRRYLDELGEPGESGESGAISGHPAPAGSGVRLTRLSPSLLADLLRFEQPGSSSEAVEVVAACMRHSSRVTIYLQCGERVVPLTVFPHERLVHCPMAMGELIERHLPQLKVMHVEPATLRPPQDALRALAADRRQCHPMAPLLWALAMRGPRRDLLPEIAGPAVYRVARGLDWRALPVISTALRATIERLQPQAVSLNALAAWPALDRERAMRLLNAVYLQGGLIVSRSHPEAVRDSWF